MARRIDTDVREATGGDALFDAPPSDPIHEPGTGDGEALVEAARRKRGPRQPGTTARKRRRLQESSEALPPARARDAHEPDEATPGGSALDGIPPGPSGFIVGGRFQIWSVTAVIALTALLVCSVIAVSTGPKPMPVSAITIAWQSGPRVPDTEVIAWMRRSPQFEKLTTAPNEWVLSKVADHLRSLNQVADVGQIRLFHEPGKVAAIRRAPGKPPVAVQIDGIRRTVEVQIGLRAAYVPAILADGSRAWIDSSGLVLPGSIPAPGVTRPVLRGIEAAGPDAVRAAVDLWQRLEPQIEKGLVTDIVLSDALDAVPTKDSLRGIVLYTRQGTRLIWGKPSEQRYGVSPETKVRDLLHTIRCQGDLSRIQAINVRFREPVFVLRERS